MKTKHFGAMLFLILPLLVSCGGKEEKKGSIAFEKAEVSPQKITEGEKASVTWKVSGNAATLLLYEERGQVPVLVSSNLSLPEGSVMVSPRESTTFRLEATGPNGKKEAWVSLEVTPKPEPPPPDPGPNPDPNPEPNPDPEPDPTPKPVCSDGVDNDGDGKIDLLDPGCSSASDTDETDPIPPPPPPPPPVDACVENPGVQFGVAGKANNIGPIVAPDENTVVFFYTTTEPDGSYVKLNRAKSVDGGVTFSTKLFREFSAIEFIPDNGTVGGILTSSGGSILNLIWVNSANNSYKLTFNRSYDLGETWTSDVVIPDSPVAGLFGSGFVSHGDNLYFFYSNSTDANKLWANISYDNGQSWQAARVVYESMNHVAIESVFIDSRGKLYMVFGERNIWVNPQTQFTSLMTSPDGANWSTPVRVQIFNESSPEVGASIVDANGVIYQWHQNGGIWKIRTSMDFSAWAPWGTPPVSGRLHVYDSGYAVVGISRAFCYANGRTLRSIMITKSTDGVNWSTPKPLQTMGINTSQGFIWPTFFGAVTPTGKINTAWETMTESGSLNRHSDVWYMREP